MISNMIVDKELWAFTHKCTICIVLKTILVTCLKQFEEV